MHHMQMQHSKPSHVFQESIMQTPRLPVEERAQLLLELGVYTFGKPAYEGEEAMEAVWMAEEDEGFEEVDFGGGSSSGRRSIASGPCVATLKRHRCRRKEAPQQFVPETNWAVVPTPIED